MFNNNLVKEFIRYLLVGGTAFIVDLILLYTFKTYMFNEIGITGVYISTAFGFIGGLIYNYILSLAFVFESAKEKSKGKDINSFIVFTIIGVAGLLFTELGMYIGVELLDINYLVVKIIVAGLVLIWNYGARKILIFR